ncbi:hypothetical protein [Sphaerotilus sp.]|uniref:hypothetical protein n=1 Tax=Sphaerotilus sp. TaxID=2093942 RepID=UPI00286E7591|nr:hypothetical protein [Sphaerotilus sp.]
MNLNASSAVDRLGQSRRQLQRALRLDARAPAAVSASADLAADLAADAVRGWWIRHPLRTGGAVAVDVANAVLRPVAQRHPLGLVAGAVLVGGLLAWSRPWRWAGRPGLVSGLCHHIAREVVAQALPHVLPQSQGLASMRSKKM